jgi:hypothetical protein
MSSYSNLELLAMRLEMMVDRDPTKKNAMLIYDALKDDPNFDDCVLNNSSQRTGMFINLSKLDDVTIAKLYNIDCFVSI